MTMDLGLPQVSEFTPKELRSKLSIHSNDRALPSFYRLPLGKIIEMVNTLPRTVRNRYDYPHRHENWSSLYEGYHTWGIPDYTDEDPRWDDDDIRREERERKMIIQSLYRGDDNKCPEFQLGKILSVPFKKRMKAFQKTPQFAELGKKLYVLKVELNPRHTSPKEKGLDRLEDPVVVWRLVTCHGDTNLNALHDQILAPAMGWRRNYHAYRFTVPTNGASIFPQDHSSWMDMTHLTSTTAAFGLDTGDYDIRHLLQEPGQRLIYTYDMGDSWCHTIKVLKIEDVGATLKGADLQHLDEQTFKAVAKKKWTLQGSSLLWGEVNCPPEDSLGCRLGRYGDILKLGRDYEVPEHDRIVNWSEHGIEYAYDFDLEAHQERFKVAISGRQNSRDGALTFVTKNPSLQDMYQAKVKTQGSFSIKMSGAEFMALSKGAQRKSQQQKVDRYENYSAVETVRKKAITTSKCNSCGKVKGSNSGLKLFVCSRCKKTNYCSVECQKCDWKKHKQTCTRPPAP